MTQGAPGPVQAWKADTCPICGEVHASIPQDEACPSHGHRLYPRLIGERWWLTCPTKACREGRWAE